MDFGQTVTALRPVEEVSIDANNLARLREAGHSASDGKIGETLEDLALGLTRVALTYRQDRFDDMANECIAIGRHATEIGLARMARVAMTVAALSKQSDAVALAANLARLMRMGNDALGAIWDLQDQIV